MYIYYVLIVSQYEEWMEDEMLHVRTLVFFFRSVFFLLECSLLQLDATANNNK